MNLSSLLPSLRALPGYAETLSALQSGGEPRLALGLMRAARPPVMAALVRDRAAAGPVLLCAARRDRALALAEELTAWNPEGFKVLPFSEPDPLFYERTAWGPRTIRNRLTVLAKLASYSMADHWPATAAPLLIIASVRSLMAHTLPPAEFIASARSIKVGQTIRLEEMLTAWVGAGYQPATVVVEPGHFSRRGGIVDIWTPAEAEPVRIELFGDEIESLRRFDPSTQRSGETLETVLVTPAREALARLLDVSRPDFSNLPADEEAGVDTGSSLEFFIPLLYPSPASLFDYLPETALIALDDWQEIEDAVNEFEEHALQMRSDMIKAGLLPETFPIPYHTLPDLQDVISSRPSLSLAPPAEEGGRVIDLGAHFKPGPRFGGQLKPLMDHLRRLRAGLDRTVVVTRQAQRLAELWGEQESYLAPTESLPADLAEGSLTFLQGALAEGWTLDPEQGGQSRLHLLTDGEIFGWARPEPRRRVQHVAAALPEAAYADFSSGDYVVHVDFGIGQFGGLVKRSIDAVEREYLRVQFGGEDELYVPIHQADRLTRYVGADDTPPRLSRLGSEEWERAIEKTREAVEQVAREMLELYAARELASGHAFSPDSAWQHELEAAFPYVETPDQFRALREVKGDMERGRPMDRLICGDVGYGKTEVALRAAFKAVMDGKQVALLVPTTILAQQHQETFRQRLAPFPITVEMLSRFKTPAEQADILGRMAAGKVDIVIGTHRLIQNDVHFKDLGLLIIDEEQRFGVTHKEHLKRMRTEVDVLTLTATPIPRTLYLSLTGVRDISTINTPPDERLPVITHVGPYSERVARQAILRELDRGGQVFYLHNRVQTIETVRRRLTILVPEARIQVAHGQMNEKQLARVMDDFVHGGIDVLLCTTIIESGLDIPNANTLIVERADAFGLAELYQLRGRVGRAAVRAYAYFFRDRKRRPSPEGYQRLETIAEQTDLGAGYSIAMRDLEIRGTGDILGTRQHGHIVAVGFHLYTRLLAQAVKRQKSQIPSPKAQGADGAQLEVGSWDLGFAVSVDLPIPTVIPADYVPDRNLRLRLYRRLAAIRDEAALQAIAAEFEDRFGPLPRPVENLLFQLEIKLLALQAGVESVSVENGQPVIRLPATSLTDLAYLQGNLDPGARMSKNAIRLPRIGEDEGWRVRLEAALRKLATIPRLPPPEAASQGAVQFGGRHNAPMA